MLQLRACSESCDFCALPPAVLSSSLPTNPSAFEPRYSLLYRMHFQRSAPAGQQCCSSFRTSLCHRLQAVRHVQSCFLPAPGRNCCGPSPRCGRKHQLGGRREFTATVSLVLSCWTDKHSRQAEGNRIVAGYIPEVWPAVIALILFGASTVVQWMLWWRTGRRKYMLTLTISMACKSRSLPVARRAHSPDLFLPPMQACLSGTSCALCTGAAQHRSVSTLSSTCSSSFRLAHSWRSIVSARGSSRGAETDSLFLTSYLLDPADMILGRLAAAMGDEASHCLLLPAARIAKFFVWSDVITFCIQAAGGGLSSGGTESMSKLGSKVGSIPMARKVDAVALTTGSNLRAQVSIAGLAIQLASFVFFTVTLIVFGFRVYRRTIYSNVSVPFRWAEYGFWRTDTVHDWRPLYWILLATCVGILVRSVFRLIEFSEGYYGYLAIHEG